MGKKKIAIEFIEDPRRRKLCFDKRQQGLIKKAMELCKLAQTDVGLIVISEEQNSLVEFWSGEKTGLVKRYQELAATPHYDFTLDDYETEISNALALRPFPSNTSAPAAPYQPSGYYNDNRPLKRPRFTLEEDSSSCYSSQPPSPVQHDEPTSAPSRATSLNSFSSQMEKPMQQLNGIQESLGKLCESYNNNDSSQLPALSNIGANNSIPQSVLPISTPTVQLTNPPSSMATTTMPAMPTTAMENTDNNSMIPTNNNTTDTIIPSINNTTSDVTTPMIADNFDAASMIGDVDFAGLLSYMGKTDTVPALPSPQCPSTPNFAGSSVWDIPTLGGTGLL